MIIVGGRFGKRGLTLGYRGSENMVKGMIDFALQSMMQFRKCFRKLNVLAPGRLN